MAMDLSFSLNSRASRFLHVFVISRHDSSVRMSDWEDRDHHPVSPYILPQRMAWLRL